MTKRAEDGVVVIDTNRCIGCGYCAWSCSYGAPQLNTVTGQMSKCDFCVDLLAQGEDPVCVATCPLHAIKHGDIEELRARYGALADARGLPSSTITKPNLVIRPHLGA
jgi:anaerobic dimethyl sulfoxide reductase subunit B (iron-sulfur subunit)